MKADETVDATGQVHPARRHRPPHPHRHALHGHHLVGRLEDGLHRRGLRRHHDASSTSASRARARSLRDAVERQKGKADGKTVVDYSIHPGVTDARPDVIDEVKKAIHEYGTPSFKIFLFYDFRVDDYAMIRLLEETKKHGGLVQVHAESFDMIRRLNEQFAADGKLAPIHHARAHAVLAEEEAVDRAAKAVEFTGSRIYIVHLSSSRGLWKIKQARDRGLRVLRGDLPAVPHADRGALQRAGLERRQVRDVARRCGRRRAWTSCGWGCGTGTCRPSAPTTARSTSRARRT